MMMMALETTMKTGLIERMSVEWKNLNLMKSLMTTMTDWVKTKRKGIGRAVELKKLVMKVEKQRVDSAVGPKLKKTTTWKELSKSKGNKTMMKRKTFARIKTKTLRKY
jgi:hypothetical protein